MKKLNLTPLFFAILFSLLVFLPAHAQQDEMPPPENENPMPPPNNRPRIMEALNLSREQMQQLRRINQTRRPFMQQAQRNWREAQLNLDAAIYADDASEEEIRLRLKEAQAAHNEFIKARTETEFLIRKILTPEQLEKFRQLRERARRMLGNPNNEPPRRGLNRFPRRQPAVQPLD